MSEKNSITEQPCAVHGSNRCFLCLKEVVEEVLYNTYMPGNGGYASDFGPIIFTKLVKLTGFDVNKRRINKP